MTLKLDSHILGKIVQEASLKKLYTIFILFVCTVSLQAKILYADFGIGNDITMISFIDVMGDAQGTENLTGRTYDYYTVPNFNLSLGLRLHSRFILMAEIQTLNINKYIDYRVELERPYWSDHKEADYRLRLESFGFAGVGIILYPNKNIQLRGSFYMGGSIYTEEITADSQKDISKGFGVGGAYNISLARDIKINKFGILIGCRYFNAKIGHVNFFSEIAPEYKVSSIGLFAKIRY